MSDDSKTEAPEPKEPPPSRPDPIEDVRKGLGLLFRAAKSAIESLPTGKVEDVVLTGAREVGRALENVTQTIDRQFFNRDRPPSDASPPQPEDASGSPGGHPQTPRADTKPPGSPGADAHAPGEAPKKSEPPPAEEPRGPRVG
jgi:hypothetical protein